MKQVEVIVSKYDNKAAITMNIVKSTGGESYWQKELICYYALEEEMNLFLLETCRVNAFLTISFSVELTKSQPCSKEFNFHSFTSKYSYHENVQEPQGGGGWKGFCP